MSVLNFVTQNLPIEVAFQLDQLNHFAVEAFIKQYVLMF